MQYCRKVRKCLPCGYKQKRQLLDKIRARALAWLEQNPSRPFAEFENAFGSPRAIAASYLEQMDGEEVLSKLAVRKRILWAVASAAAIALLIWLIGVVMATIEFYSYTRGTLKECPPIVESTGWLGEGMLATDENGEVIIPE
jgi:hypothetical protein